MHILIYQDSRLTDTNLPIAKWTNELDDMTKEMFKLMYRTDGVGLAAPQVGKNLQMFVMNISGDPSNKSSERIYFNPQVKLSKEKETNIEGCLSFPGMVGWILRSIDVEISADTPTGHIVEQFSGLTARVIQHEMDHINSILFIEKMSQADLRRNDPILRKLKSMRK
jgi:peptide deformylase